MEKIQDFKPQHKYLENQKIEKSKGKLNTLSFALFPLLIGGLISLGAIKYTEDRSKLKKQVHEIADTNYNGNLERDELFKLGRTLEEISGDSYTSNNIEGLRFEIDNAPNRIYREFINKYGDKE